MGAYTNVVYIADIGKVSRTAFDDYIAEKIKFYDALGSTNVANKSKYHSMSNPFARAVCQHIDATVREMNKSSLVRNDIEFQYKKYFDWFMLTPDGRVIHEGDHNMYNVDGKVYEAVTKFGRKCLSRTKKAKKYKIVAAPVKTKYSKQEFLNVYYKDSNIYITLIDGKERFAAPVIDNYIIGNVPTEYFIVNKDCEEYINFGDKYTTHDFTYTLGGRKKDIYNLYDLINTDAFGLKEDVSGGMYWKVRHVYVINTYQRNKYTIECIDYEVLKDMISQLPDDTVIALIGVRNIYLGGNDHAF